MKIERVLAELGLEKTKGSVYVAALGLGQGTAQDIAARAGLVRTTTHEVLQNLVRMGLVSVLMRGRTRLYSAESPEKLKMLLQEKERMVAGVLPELLALVPTKGVKPRVRFYEGVEGVKTVFEDTLTVSNKLLLSILSVQDLYQIPGKEFMDHYVARRVKAGIKLHVVRSEGKEVGETWPTSRQEAREVHYAPAGMEFPMTIYMYDHKVGIIGTQQENFGMIIESEDFYATMKNLFEVMWQVGRVGKAKD